MVEDFVDETFLAEKKRQWLHVQNELKNYLVNENSGNSKVILKRNPIFREDILTIFKID